MSILGNINFGGNLQVKAFTMQGNGDSASQKRLSWPANAGAPTLHGSWQADNSPTTSDRRLKDNIIPLSRELKKRKDEVKGVDTGSDKESPISWVLRELRPVSFKFKTMVDSKTVGAAPRYGFVAQEVERIAPDLVAKPEGGMASDAGPLSLLYQDLLAVLTLAFQEQQHQLSRQDSDVAQAQQEVTDLLDAAEKLDMVLDHFEASGGADSLS